MNNLHQYPFVRLLIPFIAGIILADACPGYLVVSAVISGLSFSAALLFVLFSRKLYSYRNSFLFGLSAMTSVFCTAYLITSNKFTDNMDNLHEIPGKEISLIADIHGFPAEKTNSIQLITHVIAIRDSLSFSEPDLRALVYLEKSPEASKLIRGDRLIFRTRLNRIRNAGNPGEFNYVKYMERKQVWWQAYVRSGDWELLDSNKGSFLMKRAANIRQHILEVLQNNGLSGQEYSVAAAILLGYDEVIDPELKAAYSGAGAMHILCVSGLHVGIIYMFLSFILGFLKKIKNGRIYRAALIIILIWLYAMITGLAPSVMRASSMFSLVALGNMLNRQSYVFNTLAASAFLILLFDPLSVFEIGFQLSYSAVFFIVWLQPRIHHLLYIRNKWLDKAWALVSVSVAATIGTFPLVVHYFHQFPNYFILTNLIVIPLSFFVVFDGIFLLLTSFLPAVSALFAFILKYLMMGMNISVSFIEALPSSTTKGLYLTGFESVSVYAIIILFVTTLSMRKLHLTKYLLLSVLVLVVSFTWNKVSQIRSSSIVVYNVRGNTGIDFIRGREHIFLADTALAGDKRKIKFHISENRIEKQLKNRVTIGLSEDSVSLPGMDFYRNRKLILFGNKMMLIQDKKSRHFSPDSLFPVDYVLFTGNPKVKIKEVSKRHQAEMIIISSDNNYYNVKRWTEEAKEENIPVHACGADGAFEVRW